MTIVQVMKRPQQTTVNLISPLNYQPEIQILEASNTSNWVNSTWINYFTTIPGYYFVNSPSNASFGFSLLFHYVQRLVSGPYTSKKVLIDSKVLIFSMMTSRRLNYWTLDSQEVQENMTW